MKKKKQPTPSCRDKCWYLQRRWNLSYLNFSCHDFAIVNSVYQNMRKCPYSDDRPHLDTKLQNSLDQGDPIHCIVYLKTFEGCLDDEKQEKRD